MFTNAMNRECQILCNSDSMRFMYLKCDLIGQFSLFMVVDIHSQLQHSLEIMLFILLYIVV